VPSMRPHYVPSAKVARMLGVSPKALGRITGNCFVRHGSGRNDSIDIGLCVKDNKNDLIVPDFCSSIQSADPNRKPIWGYTEELVGVLKSYKQKYPNVWARLDEDRMALEQVFPGMEKDAALEALKDCKKWLSNLPSAKRKLVKGTSVVASANAIRYFQASIPPPQSAQMTVEMENVTPAMLLPPIEPGGLMAAFSGGSFALGDRVVAAGSASAPPFGRRGTIVGVHDTFVEVLFDEAFDGGNDLQGRCLGNHGAVCAPSALINLSRPHAVPGAGGHVVSRDGKPTKLTHKSGNTNNAQQPRIPDGSSRGFGMGRGAAPARPPPAMAPGAPGAPMMPHPPMPTILATGAPPHPPPMQQQQQQQQHQQQRQWMPPMGGPPAGHPPRPIPQPVQQINAGMALLGQLQSAAPAATTPTAANHNPPQSMHHAQQTQHQKKQQDADAIWKLLGGKK